MINLRKKQAHAKASGIDVDTFPKRDWVAKVKWYKSTSQPRSGPPKERVDSLLSTTPIFKAAMAGGVADAKALWPEVVPSGQWSSASYSAEWEGKWRCANVQPLEIWKSQGTGIGLPLIIPLHENPKKDKALMDQLVDSGSRTIKGVAAVTGLALRKMRAGRDIRDQVNGYEEAAAEMETVMKAVRELDIKPHNEMVSGKLSDTYSIFKKRVSSKEGEESETTLEEEESEEEKPKEKDDEVDFDVTDEEAEFEEEKEEEEEVQPDEPGDGV